MDWIKLMWVCTLIIIGYMTLDYYKVWSDPAMMFPLLGVLLAISVVTKNLKKGEGK